MVLLEVCPQELKYVKEDRYIIGGRLPKAPSRVEPAPKGQATATAVPHNRSRAYNRW
jgi:hypothetical protein